jgi:hypothetical protein
MQRSMGEGDNPKMFCPKLAFQSSVKLFASHITDSVKAEDNQPHNHDHAAFAAHIFEHESGFAPGHFGHDFLGHGAAWFGPLLSRILNLCGPEKWRAICAG